MPDYTSYSIEKLIHILEHASDYKPSAIEQVLAEYEQREFPAKKARKLAAEMVREKIRAVLNRKHRLTFRPKNMVLPTSHFLSEKAVAKIFGEEYKAWKARKKLFTEGDNSRYF